MRCIYCLKFKKCIVTIHFLTFLQICNLSDRPYAYDVTEGRPRGVGGQTRHATCTIAKHALRGQTPACLTAELARVRTLTERVSANALCQQNMCAQRDKSWPPAWRRCYGDVTSMHKVYSEVQITARVPFGTANRSIYIALILVYSVRVAVPKGTLSQITKSDSNSV